MSDVTDDLDLENGIAVIGMHCMFPGASSTNQYWQNLCNSIEAVRDLSDDELISRGVPTELLNHPHYVKAAIELDGLEEFDYGFFGVSPRDAAVMDPQHRKFLECTWLGLENSGHRPSDVNGAIGIFASAGMPWYLIRNVMSHRQMVSDMGEFQVRHLSNDKDFLATRASFALNTHGPSLTVQTACSSSLVAVHLAVQSLLSNESDIAIAGGSTIDVPHGVGYLYREEEVRSNDGRCRAFDARSTGTAFGSGCATVVLRRLEDALEDGDTVHAVILGSAVNNDGSEKAGYMAPSVDFQANAIAEAIALAGVEPENIGYFETHGTGTKIGDPIEIAALTQAFGQTSKKQYCAIGSVKTNIGHLDTAAGVASLIKAVCCVRDGKIPASLHYEEANPEIDFAASPFFVNAALRDWNPTGSPRIAGVSSLGVGGTNAHAILCEPPIADLRRSGDSEMVLLPYSAKSAGSLKTWQGDFIEFLENSDALNLADVAFTLQEGRVEFEKRKFVVGDSVEDVARALSRPSPPGAAGFGTVEELVFLFSGQGSQYPGMASELYRKYAEYRQSVDECLGYVDDGLRDELKRALFARRDDADAAASLTDTSLTQPAMFILEYSLARLMNSFGFEQNAMIGHSLGEYVAATLAGVFDLRSAVRLICTRGRLIADLPRGSMIAVSTSIEDIEDLVRGNVCLAGLNAPGVTVLSGPNDEIQSAADAVQERGYPVRALHTSHAFHSSMLDPILGAFEKAVAEAGPAAPGMRFVSNVTGTWITDSEASAPDYWASHLRSAVRFCDGIRTICGDRPAAFVEIGPGNTFCGLAELSVPDASQHRFIATIPAAKDDSPSTKSLLTAVGSLWSAGLRVEWHAVRQGTAARRVQVPGYAFEKHKCWLEPRAIAERPAATAATLPIEEWIYVENWQRQWPAQPSSDVSFDHVVVFSDDSPVGSALVRKLNEAGGRVTVVKPGQTFELAGDGTVTIDPAEESHYEQIFAADDSPPDLVIHAWTLNPVANRSENADVESRLDRGFFSTLALAKAIQSRFAQHEMRFVIASTGVFRVRDESTEPLNAMMLGAARVLRNEITNLDVGLVDQVADVVTNTPNDAVDIVYREAWATRVSESCAYRNGNKYTSRFDPVALPAAAANGGLAQNGTYLITGAFGGIARRIAEALARDYRANLILVNRSQEDVDLRRHANDEFVEYLEAAGATVHRVEVDIADERRLHDALQIARQRFGSIDGIFHTAGVLDDSLVALKSREAASKVISPKVLGTLALERSLAGCSPDFQVNFSSISANAGLPGQFDYAAANAFLDAYAGSRPASGARKCITIGWSAWSEIGMSVRSELARRIPTSLSAGLRPINDELFRLTGGGEQCTNLFAILSTDNTWYLDEHRLKNGTAILPGTAYIELIAHAHRLVFGAAAIEIEDLIFAVPMELQRGESRVFHCELKHARGSAEAEVTIFSWTDSRDEPLEHAHARVNCLSPSDRPQSNADRAWHSHISDAVEDVTNDLLTFGPRWRCLAGKTVRKDSADLAIKLDPDFHPDLQAAPWHPAMLDIATGGAPELLASDGDGNGGIVPFRVQSIRLWERLRPSVFSRISISGSGEDGLSITDIDILSERGDKLVEIHGFAVRRVAADKLNMEKATVTDRAKRPLNGPDPSGPSITPQEGLECLFRLVSADVGVEHVIVCPQDLDATIQRLRDSLSSADEQEEEGEDSMQLLARPELSSEFAEAANDTERAIVRTWEKALGIGGIGVLDNFFELGGHSLLLTQIVSKIRRDHGWALPLDKVFDQLTVREWSKLVDLGATTSDIPAIKRIDRDQYRVSSDSIGRI